MNRPKLIKVLLKYSMDPIPLTIFVQSMFRGIYRTINNLDTRMGLKRQADEFGGIATDIMDMGIKEQPERAKVFFQRVLPDFNNKTSLQLAFDARDKYDKILRFLLVPHCSLLLKRMFGNFWELSSETESYLFI